MSNIPSRIEYGNILDLCGAVIRQQMIFYEEAYLNHLRGIKSYREPLTYKLVYTNKELERLDQFFDGGGIEFWGNGMINGNYIRDHAKHNAEETYKMEQQIRKMSTEELQKFIKLCSKELRKRKDKQ